MHILPKIPIDNARAGYYIFMQWLKTLKWSFLLTWLLLLSIVWTIITYNMEQASGAVLMSGLIGSAIILAPLALMLPITFQMNNLRIDCYCWGVLLLSSLIAGYSIVYPQTQPFTLWAFGMVIHALAYTGLLLYSVTLWSGDRTALPAMDEQDFRKEHHGSQPNNKLSS